MSIKTTIESTINSRLPDKRMPWESEHRFNRRMAKKYGLDFEHRCCFLDQIEHIGTGIQERFGQQKTTVEMQSGRTAEYIVEMGGYYSGTGQHDWKFTFQRYLP